MNVQQLLLEALRLTDDRILSRELSGILNRHFKSAAMKTETSALLVDKGVIAAPASSNTENNPTPNVWKRDGNYTKSVKKNVAADPLVEPARALINEPGELSLETMCVMTYAELDRHFNGDVKAFMDHVKVTTGYECMDTTNPIREFLNTFAPSTEEE